MSNGRPWSPEDDAALDDLAGTMSVERIAALLARPVITIQRHMEGRPIYRPRLAGANRRQWLLCSAAGLHTNP